MTGHCAMYSSGVLRTRPQRYWNPAKGASQAAYNPNLAGAGLFDEYYGAGADVQKAQSAVDALGSAGGRAALLDKKFEKEGNYSDGMSRFDAALAGTAGGRMFKDVKSKYGDVKKNYETGIEGMKKTLGDAQAVNNATQARHQNDLDAYLKEQEAKGSAGAYAMDPSQSSYWDNPDLSVTDADGNELSGEARQQAVYWQRRMNSGSEEEKAAARAEYLAKLQGKGLNWEDMTRKDNVKKYGDAIKSAFSMGIG